MGTKNNGGHKITVVTVGTKRSDVQLTMEKIKVLLQEANITEDWLSKYLDKFQHCGYDSLPQILSMGTADLQELREDTEMSTGHFKRLRDVINGIKNSVPTPKPVPSASSSASSSAPKRKRTTYELKTRHETTEEVRLASLRHSTQQGYSAMVDPKKSGSKARVYGCTSVLSKKKKVESDEEDDPSPACQYRLHWAWNKKTCEWNLKPKKSHFTHMPFCTAVQRVTKLELVNDPAFVKHAKLAKKNVTGKTSAQEALGGSSGRVDGSVTSYTAKRAVNDIKHVWKHDYKHDWNKLKSWGREFERKNPNAKFHLEVDNEGRCAKCPPINVPTNKCAQVSPIICKYRCKYRDCVCMWDEVCRG